MGGNQIYYNFIKTKKKIEIFGSNKPIDRWRRLFYWPAKILLRKVNHVIFKDKLRFPFLIKTFWDEKMLITFPECEELFFTGVLSRGEIPLTAFLLKVLPKKKIFFDIGAHYGFYTLLASKLIQNGSIHSFEPTPGTFEILKKNTKEKNNIFINKLALFSQTGFFDFFVHPVFAGSNTLYKDIRPGEYDLNNPKYLIKVPTTTIDNYCSSKNIFPDVIKIDVEGGEYNVFLGGINTLKKANPIISMEIFYKPLNNTSHLKAVQSLQDLNYTPFRIDKEGNLTPVNNLIQQMKEIYNKEHQNENIIFKKSI